MKRVRSLLFALLALTALGAIMASSALAGSPEILFLSGETFPVEIKQTKAEPNTIKSELQSAAGKISGEGFLLEATATRAHHGNFTALFLNVTKGTNKCTGEGESGTGEVLTDGTFLLVHDVSSTSGVGVVFSILLVLISCAAEKIHVLGNVLGLITPVGSETTSFTGILHCSATTGLPAETKYWDEQNGETSTLLLSNIGTGFKKSCEDVGLSENVELTSNKMIELMN